MKYDYNKIADLVTKIQLGDEDSFSEIYYLLYQKIYFFSLSILKDVNLAEDIVHDVFIIIKNKISTLKNPKLFIAWVNKITYNICMKELEEQKKYASINYEEDFKNIKSIDEQDDPEFVFEKKEEKDSIIKLINKLSDNHKNLILLKYYSGLKNDEIADIMGIPVGSVKSGLHYARLNLKKLATNNRMYGILFIPNISHRLNIASKNNMMEIKSDFYIKNNKNPILKKDVTIKYIMGVGIVAGAITCSSFSMYRNPAIIDIRYENQKKFTNKSVNIEIIVDNNKYIKDIYIMDNDSNKYEVKTSNNESYIFSLDKNGEYSIYINSKIYENININFIDKEKPKINDYEYDKYKLNISVEDNLSKIDYDKSYIMDINGKIIKIDERNMKNDRITIDIPKNNLTLFLFDNAGNKSKYKISIKYK